MAGAKSAGIDVPAINWKAFGVIFISGLVSHTAMYLAKSPLPNALDTNFWQRADIARSPGPDAEKGAAKAPSGTSPIT